MKFEGSGSKGTCVIERKRSVTDRQTDGQGKNNMSPPEGVGGGDIIKEYMLGIIKALHSFQTYKK